MIFEKLIFFYTTANVCPSMLPIYKFMSIRNEFQVSTVKRNKHYKQNKSKTQTVIDYYEITIYTGSKLQIKELAFILFKLWFN